MQALTTAGSNAEIKPLRIVISASKAPNVLESEYAKRLDDLSCTLMKHYAADEQPSRIKGVARKIVRRIAPRLLWQQSNVDLLCLAESSAPDIVWLFKGTDIFPSTIRALRHRGFHPVAYNPDHPFEFYSRGTGNANIAQSLPEYELFMTFSRHIANQLSEKYPSLQTCVVPFGHAVDEDIYRTLDDVDEINRICFIGTPDLHRVSLLSSLLRAGLKVDIYGPDWGGKSASLLKGAYFHGPVFGLEFYRTLRRYRVQLNFLRPHNLHSHNMRSFEAPACGAIMLAEDSIEHREFFQSGEEAFYFSCEEELVEISRWLLAMSMDEAKGVREKARARSVNERYSYSDRAIEALSHMGSLVGR